MSPTVNPEEVELSKATFSANGPLLYVLPDPSVCVSSGRRIREVVVMRPFLFGSRSFVVKGSQRSKKKWKKVFLEFVREDGYY